MASSKGPKEKKSLEKRLEGGAVRFEGAGPAERGTERGSLTSFGKLAEKKELGVLGEEGSNREELRAGLVAQRGACFGKELVLTGGEISRGGMQLKKENLKGRREGRRFSQTHGSGRT